MVTPSVFIPVNFVPMKGFRWSRLHSLSIGDLALEPWDPSDVEERRVRPARGVADEAVFLEFAELTVKEDEFRKFANSYGPLFSGGDLVELLALPTPQETFLAWKGAHEALVPLVTLWRDDLGPGTGWTDNHAQLVRDVNKHLSDGCQLQLAKEFQESVSLEIVPKNLVAAIWLRFAEAVASEAEFRRCERCSRWFGVGVDGRSRSARRYCSTTCRLASYRGRQLEAIELAKDGMRVIDIAVKLHSTPEIVKGWIASGGPNAIHRERERLKREQQAEERAHASEHHRAR